LNVAFHFQASNIASANGPPESQQRGSQNASEDYECRKIGTLQQKHPSLNLNAWIIPPLQASREYLAQG
jgi:hypothetical protein